MNRIKKKPTQSGISLPFIFLLILIVFLPAGTWFFSQWREDQKYHTLNRKLESLGELTTITQLYRSVFYINEKKYLIQEKSILFTAEFNVHAGIDLAEGFDLQLKGNQARLILPAGKILMVDGDDSSFDQILIRERFSTIDTGDYLPLISAERDNIREQALRQGVPGLAEERGAVLMKGILRAAGIENVTILFRAEGPVAGQTDPREAGS